MNIYPKKYRLWTLGNLEYKILPTREAIERLKCLLKQSNTDTVDIVWGPDLSVKEIQNESSIENYVVDSISEDGDKIFIKAHKV